MKPVARTNVVAVAAALTMVGWLPGGVSPASGEEPRPALGETRVFTRVPHPGSGGGIVVDGDTVWTTTVSFMDPEVERWPVWAYDRRTGREKVDQRFTVRRAGPAVMALRGMARDAQGRLYLVDMNGRVLRTTVTSAVGRPTVDVYATIPGHGNGAAYIPWAGASMPVDITFDVVGNAYLADYVDHQRLGDHVEAQAETPAVVPAGASCTTSDDDYCGREGAFGAPGTDWVGGADGALGAPGMSV